MLTRCYATQVVHRKTNTSSTHWAVQTHIPLVGSWSMVRKCEICQPIGDWVIEEFDSERNILLPWWWTRRNNTTFSRRRVESRRHIDWSLIQRKAETVIKLLLAQRGFFYTCADSPMIITQVIKDTVSRDDLTKVLSSVLLTFLKYFLNTLRRW